MTEELRREVPEAAPRREVPEAAPVEPAFQKWLRHQAGVDGEPPWDVTWFERTDHLYAAWEAGRESMMVEVKASALEGLIPDD